MLVFVCGYTRVYYEVAACTCTREACLQAQLHFYIVSVFLFIWVPPYKDRCWENPRNQSWSRTIITAILIKVFLCDPLIFSQCWLHCSAVTTSITKQQPMINLHIIYMSPNQHTVNPNLKITPTWTAKHLPLSNLNILPSWYDTMMMPASCM